MEPVDKTLVSRVQEKLEAVASDGDALAQQQSRDASQSMPVSPTPTDLGEEKTSASKRFGSFFKKKSVKAHKRSNSAPMGDAVRGPAVDAIGQKLKGWKNSLESLRDMVAGESHDIDFLKSVKRTAAQDTASQIKTFLAAFDEDLSRPVTDSSNMVLDFYGAMRDRMEDLPAWRGTDQKVQDEVMDGVVRHVMLHIYDSVFTADPKDEEKDLAFQSRVRRLQWVTPSHLEANIDLENPAAMVEFEKAQDALIILDARRGPQEKLDCIVACSKAVFLCLKLSAQSTQGDASAASADDFLPLLIYVVLKANPPLIHSNMEFINRFGNPEYVMKGEAGYYFTNLLGAVSFIDNVNESHLKMAADEFEARMSEETGTGRLGNEEDLSVIANMRNYLLRLRRLAARQKSIQEDVDLLNGAISRLCVSAVNPIPSAETGSRIGSSSSLLVSAGESPAADQPMGPGNSLPSEAFDTAADGGADVSN